MRRVSLQRQNSARFPPLIRLPGIRAAFAEINAVVSETFAVHTEASALGLVADHVTPRMP